MRIISAFNFAKYLIKFDCSKIHNVNNLNIHTNIGHEGIKEKIRLRTKYMFSQKFDYLITYFKDVNDFLESLSSNNLDKKNNSKELIKYTLGIKGYEYVGMFLGYNYHFDNFGGKNEMIWKNTDEIKLRMDDELHVQKILPALTPVTSKHTGNVFLHFL